MKIWIGLLLVITPLFGCITQNVAPNPNVLRVGVTPNSQPIIFKQGHTITGIEADFSKKIGAALGKEIHFIEVPWNKQIEYLEQNKTDIIMSGMTQTSARSIRINFATPYMQSGMSGLFRRNSYDPTGLAASIIINQNKRIGYLKNTTGEIFVMQRFLRTEKVGFSTATAAVKALKNGKIDMFIYDAPMVWWLSAMNESDLVAFPDLLNIEPLAWGVRKGQMDLLDQLNELVLEWEQDGTSQRIIQNWIPLAKP